MEKDKSIALKEEISLPLQRKRKQVADMHSRKEKIMKLTNKSVRRKLTFDNLEKEESSRESREEKAIEMVKKPSFSTELENLLNISLEENRKRCIEKYNFDPVLEKPLDGKFIWEKVVD